MVKVGNKKNSLLKRTTAVLLLLFITSGAYVVFINRNSKEMTLKQKILKAVYPAFMWLSKKAVKEERLAGEIKAKPTVPFHSLKATSINGSTYDFDQLKGKYVMLVNTASDCGYTGQYEELEKLYNTYKQKLIIIAFPSNDFKEQEKGSDDAIEKFCKINYGITFPLMKKSTVKKQSGQNEVFDWLTHASKNGWNDRSPAWNFSKYLVDGNGNLVNYFPPAVSPMDKAVLTLLNK